MGLFQGEGTNPGVVLFMKFPVKNHGILIWIVGGAVIGNGTFIYHSVFGEGQKLGIEQVFCHLDFTRITVGGGETIKFYVNGYNMATHHKDGEKINCKPCRIFFHLTPVISCGTPAACHV